MKLSKLMHEIITSELACDDIDKLQDLLKRKRRQSAPILRVGDICTIGNIRPLTLKGKKVEVRQVHRTKVTAVLLEETAGVDRKGDQFRVPMSCLTLCNPESPGDDVADDAAGTLIDQTI